MKHSKPVPKITLSPEILSAASAVERACVFVSPAMQEVLDSFKRLVRNFHEVFVEGLRRDAVSRAFARRGIIPRPVVINIRSPELPDLRLLNPLCSTCCHYTQRPSMCRLKKRYIYPKQFACNTYSSRFFSKKR